MPIDIGEDGEHGDRVRFSALVPLAEKYKIQGWDFVIHAASSNGDGILYATLERPETDAELAARRYIINVATSDYQRRRLAALSPDDFEMLTLVEARLSSTTTTT